VGGPTSIPFFRGKRAGLTAGSLALITFVTMLPTTSHPPKTKEEKIPKSRAIFGVQVVHSR